jgi:heat shock protein HslJ
MQASTLTQQPWQWRTTASADGTRTVAADPTRYTIAFRTDGSLAIRADCNAVLGSYTVHDAELRIQFGPSTLVGCPPDSQADQFLADLAQAATRALVDDMLQLGLANGGQMLLAPHPLPNLVGPTWHATAYDNGREAVQSLLDGTQITATFGEDGRVVGSAGCNRYTGQYQASDGSLTIGQPATTRMACAPPVMGQEAAYLAALQAATRFQFENDALVLRDAAGAIQAMFVLGEEC